MEENMKTALAVCIFSFLQTFTFAYSASAELASGPAQIRVA